MGVQNRITAERFDNIKTFFNKNAKKHNKLTNLDAKACEKFGIGKTTARTIRHSRDYTAYCEQVFRFHGRPGKKASNLRMVKLGHVSTPESVKHESRGDKFAGKIAMEDTRAQLWTIRKEQDIHLAHINTLHKRVERANSMLSDVQDDGQLVLENQLALNDKLRVYAILNGIILVAIALATALVVYMGAK